MIDPLKIQPGDTVRLRLEDGTVILRTVTRVPWRGYLDVWMISAMDDDGINDTYPFAFVTGYIPNDDFKEKTMFDPLKISPGDTIKIRGRDQDYRVTTVPWETTDGQLVISVHDGKQQEIMMVDFRLIASHTPCPPCSNPFDEQVGGNHYKDMAIQPVKFIHKNGIGYIEGSVIAYLCRWRTKGGVEDLRKARQFLDFLIYMESE